MTEFTCKQLTAPSVVDCYFVDDEPPHDRDLTLRLRRCLLWATSRGEAIPRNNEAQGDLG